MRSQGIYSLFLFALFLLEIFGLTEFYDLPESYPVYPHEILTWLLVNVKEYWQIALWILGSLLLLISPKYQHILIQWKEISISHKRKFWLMLQLLTFTSFCLFTHYFFAELNQFAQLNILYLSLWFSLAAGTFCFWLICLAPARFWFWFIKNYRIEIIAGITAGLCAWMLTGMLVRQEAPLGQKQLWIALSTLTLEAVYFLLSGFYSQLIYQPDSLIVGTYDFPIEVSYACSGIEGVSLIVIFLTIYLGLFRKELRFPQVFWLYPIGIATIWLANSVRIFLMIAVGTSFSKEIASKSLHAQAGWIVFTLVSLGAIFLSHQSRFFSLKALPSDEKQPNDSEAAALLIPLLVQLAVSMVAAAFNDGFDLVYPVKIILIGSALCYFWKFYRTVSWKWSWQSLAIGAGVFVFWLILEQDNDSKSAVLAKNLGSLTDLSATIWIFFRIVGSSIVVPIAEELAFRGYLTRKLISNDFENVPLGQFSLLSFLISSLLFGLLHDRWFAGMLAGMCYAGALYRRKQLGDAIAAHMTTNSLIAAYVLIAQKWSLWA